MNHEDIKVGDVLVVTGGSGSEGYHFIKTGALVEVTKTTGRSSGDQPSVHVKPLNMGCWDTAVIGELTTEDTNYVYVGDLEPAPVPDTESISEVEAFLNG